MYSRSSAEHEANVHGGRVGAAFHSVLCSWTRRPSPEHPLRRAWLACAQRSEALIERAIESAARAPAVTAACHRWAVERSPKRRTKNSEHSTAAAGWTKTLNTRPQQPPGEQSGSLGDRELQGVAGGCGGAIAVERHPLGGRVSGRTQVFVFDAKIQIHNKQTRAEHKRSTSEKFR